MRILEAPDAKGADGLKIERVFQAGKRWAPKHVHLDFSERFEIVSGIADARLAGSEQRLAAGDTFYAGAGMEHVNPTNRDTSELVYKQSFIPATEGARSYVKTLAQVLRDGRDEDGELPWSLVLAIGDVTRERTYARPLPYWFQRRVLLPAGRYVAGARGFGVQLTRAPASSPVRRGKVGGATK